MQKRNLIVALACAYTLIATPPIFADENHDNMQKPMMMHEHHMSWFHHHHFEKMAKKLDLTEDQQQQIKKIRDEAKTLIEEKRTAYHNLREQVNTEFKNDSMTQFKVDEYAAKESKIVDDMLKIMLTERFNAYSVLHKDQKEKLSGLIEKWKEKHHRNK